METLAIGVLLLMVFVLLTAPRSSKPQVVFVMEESSRPGGCLLLAALAVITFLAISR
ncbi:MAG TPA: hypothetical protein VFZ66_28445 [Herpetosiphonaceae bacterium]